MSADGENVVGHAGARLLSDLADELGLTEALSVAMAWTKQRCRGHDRGQVLVDVATMIADGGEAISDLAVLRDQPSLFGEVASVPTAWRTLEAIDGETLAAIAQARAAARAAAWAAGADPGFYVIDFDGTLIGSHSDKEGAAPTYKRGFGFHPLLAILDGTGEALAGILRPGNAASNATADHVRLLDLALAQLPVDPAARASRPAPTRPQYRTARPLAVTEHLAREPCAPGVLRRGRTDPEHVNMPARGAAAHHRFGSGSGLGARTLRQRAVRFVVPTRRRLLGPSPRSRHPEWWRCCSTRTT